MSVTDQTDALFRDHHFLLLYKVHEPSKISHPLVSCVTFPRATAAPHVMQGRHALNIIQFDKSTNCDPFHNEVSLAKNSAVKQTLVPSAICATSHHIAEQEYIDGGAVETAGITDKASTQVYASCCVSLHDDIYLLQFLL